MVDKTILFLQADQLMRKALKEEAKGEFDRALEFMNTSIEILENANLDAFQFKAQRELLYLVKSQSKDFSGLISVYENALEAILRRKNPVELIDTLIPLVGWCIQAKNKLKALDYLQKAENILANTTPEAMSQYLSEKSYFTGESFIRFRSADISRKREVLQKM